MGCLARSSTYHVVLLTIPDKKLRAANGKLLRGLSRTHAGSTSRVRRQGNYASAGGDTRRLLDDVLRSVTFGFGHSDIDATLPEACYLFMIVRAWVSQRRVRFQQQLRPVNCAGLRWRLQM